MLGWSIMRKSYLVTVEHVLDLYLSNIGLILSELLSYMKVVGS